MRKDALSNFSLQEKEKCCMRMKVRKEENGALMGFAAATVGMKVFKEGCSKESWECRP